MTLYFHHHYDLWIKTPLGASIFFEEAKVISRFFKEDPKNFWLQIGGPTLLTKMPVFSSDKQKKQLENRIYLYDEISYTTWSQGYQVVANSFALPFAADSIQMIVSWHSLDVCDSPKDAFLEMARVLGGEGRLMIFTFNPFSLLGLKKIWQKWWLQEKLNQRIVLDNMISSFKLKRWLKESGFQIVHEQKIFFRPPVNNKKFLARTAFVESFGSLFFDVFGNINVIVADKKVVSLTAIPDIEFG
jgi:hypothetical protein